MKAYDHLQKIIKQFEFNTTQITSTRNFLDANISDEEDNFLEGEQLDTLLNSFSAESTYNDTINYNIPQKFSFALHNFGYS